MTQEILPFLLYWLDWLSRSKSFSWKYEFVVVLSAISLLQKPYLVCEFTEGERLCFLSSAACIWRFIDWWHCPASILIVIVVKVICKEDQPNPSQRKYYVQNNRSWFKLQFSRLKILGTLHHFYSIKKDLRRVVAFAWASFASHHASKS